MSAGLSPLFALGFSSPWLLLGIVLIGLPVLLHLLRRRQHREEPFAANRFLAEAARKNSRRLRFQQWLLLAIRMLLLGLLAISLARPFLDSTDARQDQTTVTHHLLILDASLSMRFHDAEASRFDRGRELLEQLVRGSRVGDTFRLLTIRGARPPIVIGQAAGRQDDVLEELHQLAPTYETGDVVAALQATIGLLREIEHEGLRRVSIVSDFQQTAWQPESSVASGRIRESLKQLDRLADLVVYDVAGSSAGNSAIIDLNTNEPVTVVGAPVRVQATLQHFGTAGPAEQLVELHVDGRQVGRRKVSLSPGQTLPVNFSHRFISGGEHRIEVRLEDDGLVEDNRRFLAVPVRTRLAVLLVNGRYAGRPEDAATYYVSTALQPGHEGIVEPVTVTERDLVREDLDRYDCVVLCDVAQLDPVETGKLQRFVSGGGGLVIGLGDRVQLNAWNRLAQSGSTPLLPARLETAVRASESKRGAFLFDPQGYGHPLLEEFRGVEGNGLETTLTLHYVRSRPLSGSRVALGFDSGDPALITSVVGHGRVVLLTTSLDSRWTTWPVLSPSYLPMIHELVLFATSGRWSQRRGLVGDAIQKILPSELGAPSAEAIDPSSVRHQLNPRVTTENPGVTNVQFSETLQPGHYRLVLGRPVEATELYAVNVDTFESNLEVVPTGDLSHGLLAGLEALIRTDWEATETPSMTTHSTDPLSRNLLGLVLGLLLVELVMAWRFNSGTWLLGILGTGWLMGWLLGWLSALAVVALVGAGWMWHKRYRRHNVSG